MKIIIDRFEGNYAVCETEGKKFIDIPKSDIPEGAKEGDILRKTDTDYRIEIAETKEKREEIKKRMNSLFVN